MLGENIANQHRLEREWHTIQIMISMYCQGHHQPVNRLCDDCKNLTDYADQRLKRCRYGVDKPTCVKCPTHCYKPDMRDRIREVMRYAGPRMIFRHPWLAVMHLIDGKKSEALLDQNSL